MGSAIANPVKNMDNPIHGVRLMKNEKMPMRYIANYFHTPSDFAQSAFLHVLRAGHLKAAPDYRVDRRFCAGHDLIYCMKGRGYIRIEGKEHAVNETEVLWIDGRSPHVHWAEANDPWEVLWLRADGHTLTSSAEALNVVRQPVFTVGPRAATNFHAVVRHLQAQPLALDALLHADVSVILSLLFQQRRSLQGVDPENQGIDPGLKRAIEKMGVYYYKAWSVRALAKEAGMSEPHFYRRFHRATGSSPISWLRRQRVNHAKRRLVETTDSIKQIAEQVGYSDPFYFSRDFKLACGISPKHYREQEGSHSDDDSSDSARGPV
jgi:AraC-like DNA-binding protein